jgi:FlaA1/EpsC-like NDP-sugar epimerase
LDTLITAHEIQHLIIAIPSASQAQIRQISQLCRDIDKTIELKILPTMADVIEGKTSIKSLRNIEPEDLLGRKAHDLDMNKMSSMLKDKVVLVTGAGGSIGSELCKQIAKFQPKLLVLFEVTELFLYQLEQTMCSEFPDVPLQSVIGDVRNYKKLSHVFETYKPQVVFHAAAYKHVPLMELNPIEAVRTNVLGTYNVAMASVKNKVDRFVLISSDKAINPTNVMGATKRIAEMVCLSCLPSGQTEAITKFTIVRFGNVLGSSGSVIPLFKKQIEKGGPVTITHPDMKRYFMSIPEATQLVIQAGALGKGAEVMVLDMGEPVKIKDLAYEMIALAGHQPEVDIPIVYSGLRPGEKLFEELFQSNEVILPTLHPMVKIAKTAPPDQNFKANLDFLMTLSDETAPSLVKEAIKNLLADEYKCSDLNIAISDKVH